LLHLINWPYNRFGAALPAEQPALLRNVYLRSFTIVRKDDANETKAPPR